MIPHKKIYILYAEAMPYVAAVWDVLAVRHQCHLIVVHWDKNKHTPYTFDSKSLLAFVRSQETIETLMDRLNTFKPDVLYVSGRMDKDYLTVAHEAKTRGIPVVMGSDKQWHGGLKDYLAVLLQKYLYKPYFTHAWIPGSRQYAYANRVGFKAENILPDLLSGNIQLFNSFYHERDRQRTRKDILFVGRLNKAKGILPLITVLARLRGDGIFTGKLWVLGNGTIKDKLLKNDWIIHEGFTNQQDMAKTVQNTAIFCLPSIKEPWGVVIHEMAAAGIPICCSDACGAATHFVKDGYNGRIFRAGNWTDLYSKLEWLIKLPLVELNQMGERGHQLAQLITPQSAALSLLSIWSEAKEK
ncbi:MAG: glycosyltransferase family 4 protein [Gammaproteobacteria bacterium]|nr:glycosyltransferase family 4 protein [Gammaproteobacteria bacterium]